MLALESLVAIFFADLARVNRSRSALLKGIEPSARKTMYERLSCPLVTISHWDEYSIFVPYRHRFPLLMVSPGRDHLAGAGRSGLGGSPETKHLAVSSGMVGQSLEATPHRDEQLLPAQ